jgi:hypothetical protein
LILPASAFLTVPHIVARKSGLPIELEKVDTRAKKTASGSATPA